MADTFDGPDVLGSNEPAKNGYGQNGFPGSSSDVPNGKPKTTSGFLPQAVLPKEADDGQTRPVDKTPYPTTFGMHNPNSNPAQIPRVLSRGSARGR
jgi:hypothetical protein